MEPINQALKDTDPYVRKTAALCLAKLYAHSPDLVERENGIDKLYRLLSDGNATVIASAVSALMDIHQKNEAYDLVVDMNMASRLLTAINDCNESLFLSLFVFPLLAIETENK